MVVAGIDIGGTKIAAGLVDATGKLLARAVVPTPSVDGPRTVLAAAASAVRQLGGPVSAAGVGSAGVIDPDTGVVRSATNTLPDWAGTPLRAELSALLGVPVAVDNDVHAHALGEVWRGPAAGHRTVLSVVVGTGVGGSIVIDGLVHHGRSAAAGHIGHVPVARAAGQVCTCGGEGHVEAVASGPALLAEYRRRSAATRIDLLEVAERAERGDRIAAEVLAAGALALGEGVGGVMNVIAPDIVLFNGGVSACGDAWWAPLRSAITSQVLPPLREVPLVRSELGGDAALLGAAKLGWEVLT